MTKNQLIVKKENQISLVMDDLFKEVDFSGLNKVIDNIAEHNEFTENEKQLANELIEQWNEDVISRLYTKNAEMGSFLEFLDTSERRGGFYEHLRDDIDLIEDYGEILAEKTNTLSEFDEYMNARNVLEDHQQNRPEKNVFGLDTSISEKLEKEKNYELEMKKYEIQEVKLKREMYTLDRKWKKLINENKDVKKLVQQAKKFNKNLNKLVKESREKARLAKLNVSISSKESRKILRELLDFINHI